MSMFLKQLSGTMMSGSIAKVVFSMRDTSSLHAGVRERAVGSGLGAVRRVRFQTTGVPFSTSGTSCPFA